MLFGILGGLGCIVGCILAEPLLLAIRPDLRSGGNTGQVLVFSPEFNRRLAREGAKTGDIQISLMWPNINDLDLHCVDPLGEEIYFSHKTSKTGGELDVDMNVSPPLSTAPVENIFWGATKAPQGTYKVYVDHYKNHGAQDPTPFTVGIKKLGTAKELTGNISHGDRPVLVEEFTVGGGSLLGDVFSAASTTAIIVIGIWTSFLAVGLALLLAGGQNMLLRKSWFMSHQALRLALGGILAGMVAGSFSQMAFALLPAAHWLAIAGRICGWSLLGAMLGYGMAFVIPNLPRRKAIKAGAIGGLVGSVAFLAAAAGLPDILARLFGASILGASIGMMIAIAEKMAREACLIVHWGPHERTVINLGDTPVVLGCSNEAQLYLPKEQGFPPVAALVTFKGGKIELENRMTQSTHELRGGNKLKLGNLLVEVHADNSK